MGKHALVKEILPALMNQLTDTIETKLNAAVFINLITDIWSSIATIPYLGLEFSLIYENFTRETITVGLEKMLLPQNAENCKLAIETIINSFEFNKAKISAVVCDEGKNLLRLFKAADGAYYLETGLESEHMLNENENVADEADADEADADEAESDDDETQDEESDEEILKDLHQADLNLNLSYKIRDKPNRSDRYDNVQSDDEYDLSSGMNLNLKNN